MTATKALLMTFSSILQDLDHWYPLTLFSESLCEKDSAPLRRADADIAAGRFDPLAGRLLRGVDDRGLIE